MAARKPTPTPAPADDPLADLREPEPEPVVKPGVLVEPEEEPEEGIPDARPTVSQEVMDEMVTEAVVAFHQDPTSQGFLHGGGQCGCRYLARTALQAAVPVALPAEELEEPEGEPEESADG